MKTATVTWITYNNYGTLLQAYALQKKIEQIGYDNVIISDEDILKEYQKNKHIVEKKVSTERKKTMSKSRGSRFINLIKHPGIFYRSILARVDREKYERPYEESQAECEKFKQRELHILNNIITEELSRLNEQFDIFIAGSDQVWSIFENIFNPYYYLEFVTKTKVAYAPSLGTDKISDEIVEKLKVLLKDYSAVSVRENTSAQQLSKLIGEEVVWVADPTLLHDRKFWSEFTEEIPVTKKKYLLCYFLENKKWYFEYARKLAKQLHLKIVLIPNKWDYISSEYVMENGVGPKEFVSLIQHAEYVLTDSYHGSIFSLIFEKNFQYLLRFSYEDLNSQNIRIQSLFELLDLNERIVDENDIMFPELYMNYELIRKRIAIFREKSIKYLIDSLKEK